MIVGLLLGCSSTPPPPPADTLVLSPTALTRGARSVAAPASADRPGTWWPGIEDLLTDLPLGEVSLQVDPGTPWGLLRLVLNAAEEAHLAPLRLQVGSASLGPWPARRATPLRPDCDGRPIRVRGIGRRLSLHLAGDGDRVWLEPIAHFWVLDEHGRAWPGLDPACWRAESCAERLDDPHQRIACELAQQDRAPGAEPAPARSNQVALHQDGQCWLPPSAANQWAGWGEPLGALVKRFGLEGEVAFSAADAVPAAAVAGLIQPLAASLGHWPEPSPLGVEGSREPPDCQAGAGSPEELKLAEGYWLGSASAGPEGSAG